MCIKEQVHRYGRQDMGVCDDILRGSGKIAVVGLGYVGMPLAYEFSKKVPTIGFDIDSRRIEMYKNGIDITGEIGGDMIRNSRIEFTSSQERLAEALFIVVAVPTPINRDKTPDLAPIKSAAALVGRNMPENAVVVFESTVYPGVTEEVCLPILESESGMKAGSGFSVGYSPERINPGDREHTVSTIRKIVSGMDDKTLDDVASVYRLIVDAGVYRAHSIKVAEAAKVIENAQRDINIAFMNELSVIFNRLGIDTSQVLEAAATKWNFLKFYPGLVGGHCIGVDPYYLSYRAEMTGYHPQIILSGRRINDAMGKYVAENTVKQLIRSGRSVLGSRVLVMGLAFKENIPDIRNTRVMDVIRELVEYGVEVYVNDPVADPEQARKEYGIALVELKDARRMDAIVVAVAHRQYTLLSLEDLKGMYNDGRFILVDIRGVYDRKQAEDMGFIYWSL